MALLSSGTRISDTLVADRLLGEGAFAEVHRVRHEYLGWQAMKLFKRVASIEETREMLGEARILSTLGHPNIVRLFDANTVQTSRGLRGYFTMEYVPGGSLERFIRSHQPGVSVEVAVDVLEQVAAGLAVAHEQSPPIIHRDLTPANILVGYDGTGMRVRVSDFGLAKRADPFTLAASSQGTFAFMAPEVLRDEGCSRAGDVWALGTVAYLLLTNHFPYGAGGPLSSYSLARFRESLLPPSRYNEAVDPELDRIVMATLELDPRNRPETARTLADALRERRLRRGERGEHEGRGEHEKPGVPAPAGARAPSGANGAPHGTGTDRAAAVPPSERARRLAGEALELSRHPATLHQAADLMEEAVNLSPRLRAQYLPRLTLWRRGVMM